MRTTLNITIGTQSFVGRLRIDSAAQSCMQLQELLPYRGNLIHARWSGESLWSPLASRWPRGRHLPEEDATSCPLPGEILLYAGAVSEPELLVVYGPSRFACSAGPLSGNRVLCIEHDLHRLAELGRDALWHGALPLLIE